MHIESNAGLCSVVVITPDFEISKSYFPATRVRISARPSFFRLSIICMVFFFTHWKSISAQVFKFHLTYTNVVSWRRNCHRIAPNARFTYIAIIPILFDNRRAMIPHLLRWKRSCHSLYRQFTWSLAPQAPRDIQCRALRKPRAYISRRRLLLNHM